jgi:(R,R)-butanediol dehydrogenase/meso-butanediol dehydrogenase/diacetyl reductase
MKAAVYYGIRDVRVEEMQEPKPGHGEIKVKVKYCGICGSDLHEYTHGLFPMSYFGHEVAGEIVEVGTGVEDLNVGERVSAFSKGGYAEYMVASVDQTIRAPDDVSWEKLAVLEPLAVAANAVARGGIKAGDTALIAGAGPVGLMLLVSLKKIGAKSVYVTDPTELRRKKAEELGATRVFNPLDRKIPAEIREMTGGDGVDYAFEAVGVEGSMKDCLASARRGGIVVVQGIFTERVPMHMLGFVSKEITMMGTTSLNPKLAREWIADPTTKPELIVTSIISLDDIQRRGFEVLTSDKNKDIKILVAP